MEQTNKQSFLFTTGGVEFTASQHVSTAVSFFAFYCYFPCIGVPLSYLLEHGWTGGKGKQKGKNYCLRAGIGGSNYQNHYYPYYIMPGVLRAFWLAFVSETSNMFYYHFLISTMLVSHVQCDGYLFSLTGWGQWFPGDFEGIPRSSYRRSSY